MDIEYTLAKHGAEKLWKYLQEEAYVQALGAVTGNQAVQMVRAGLKAVYASGWQIAADANVAGETYPDLSLYPASSGPALVRRINNALQRADQIAFSEGDESIDWFQPIVADAEAGFGGNLNAFELTKAMIEAGAAAVHFEDQQATHKKCGHMGGKVLVSTGAAIQKLIAARLAADVIGVPTLIIARTDACGAFLIVHDVDPADKPFITKERTEEGFHGFKGGLDASIARCLAYAPYADMLWFETATPDIKEAHAFADAIHKRYPDKNLAYNCSPSFNWKRHLDDKTIARFQEELGEMGYAFQFVTLAGFHSLNYGMFDLAKNYLKSGMSAYVALQEKEFADEEEGYTATKHQHEVGAGYFDEVARVISGENATFSLRGSTEEEQFEKKKSGRAIRRR